MLKPHLSKIGQISVDIGQHVGNTLNDIFTALITGTLKSVDIGKSALATLGRIVTDAFSQIMQKKLSFELDLFSNMRNLPGQATNAITSGGGFGGILDMILYGTGGQLQGPVKGPDTGGGGGLSGIFGGLLQGIGRMFGLGGQGGFGGGGIMGDIGSIISGASGGGGGGGGAGGIIGGIFGGIGNVWTMISNTQLGTQISAWVANAVASISETVSTIASTVSNAVSSVLSSISWIPYIGWVIAAITMIYRIIANQQERPNVKLSGEFGGVAFDPATQQFIPGEINVGIGRKVGIKNSQAGALATNLQQRLIILSNQWTDILNVFPDFLSKDIIPALDETNERLRYNFANLKFSPGGSRNLQQEIEAMSGPNGLVRMLNAFLPALSAGFTGALGAAGIPSAGTMATGFRNLEPKPYWEFPQEDWDKFIQALKDTATLTGSLASTGASKFLAPADLAAMGSIFDALFAQTDVKTFTEMAAKLRRAIKASDRLLDILSPGSYRSFWPGAHSGHGSSDRIGRATRFSEFAQYRHQRCCLQGVERCLYRLGSIQRSPRADSAADPYLCHAGSHDRGNSRHRGFPISHLASDSGDLDQGGLTRTIDRRIAITRFEYSRTARISSRGSGRNSSNTSSYRERCHPGHYQCLWSWRSGGSRS